MHDTLLISELPFIYYKYSCPLPFCDGQNQLILLDDMWNQNAAKSLREAQTPTGGTGDPLWYHPGIYYPATFIP